MTALTLLIGKGFEVGADGEKILISPAAKLTDETRQWIRDHRSELLAELHHRTAANSPKMPPHALLVRVANLLGCSGDYLLECGLLEPCDLEEQAHTDPWIIAEGIRLDPRWQPPSKAAQTYVEPSEGQGLPEPYQTHWTAAMASADWLQARDAFHNHIFGCPECYPPLGRYCSIGQALHQHYQDCHG